MSVVDGSDCGSHETCRLICTGTAGPAVHPNSGAVAVPCHLRRGWLPSCIGASASVNISLNALLFRRPQAGDIALGLLVGGYKPSRFSSDPAPAPVEHAVIFSLGVGPGLDAAAQLAANLARGVTFARCMLQSILNIHCISKKIQTCSDVITWQQAHASPHTPEGRASCA